MNDTVQHTFDQTDSPIHKVSEPEGNSVNHIRLEPRPRSCENASDLLPQSGEEPSDSGTHGVKSGLRRRNDRGLEPCCHNRPLRLDLCPRSNKVVGNIGSEVAEKGGNRGNDIHAEPFASRDPQRTDLRPCVREEQGDIRTESHEKVGDRDNDIYIYPLCHCGTDYFNFLPQIDKEHLDFVPIVVNGKSGCGNGGNHNGRPADQDSEGNANCANGSFQQPEGLCGQFPCGNPIMEPYNQHTNAAE